MSLTLTLERGGGEVSGSGTNIELDGTIAGGAIESVEMYGDTQQTTYSGRNLNVYPYTGGGSGRGITFTANSDGTVVLNGQNDGQGNSVYFFFNNQSNPMTLPAGTYYIAPPSNTRVGFVMYDGTTYYGFSSSNGYSVTFSSSVSIRQFYVQVYHTDVTFSDLKIYPMLTTSAQHTEADWEPYVGGTASPNPDYPQEVQVVTGEQTVTISDGQGNEQTYPVNLGKNLFDTEQAVTKFENSAGATVASWGSYSDGVVTITRSNGAYGATLFAGFIPRLIEGETYTLSATVRLSGTASGTGLRIGTNDTTPVYITLSSKDTWLDASFTFTATAQIASDPRICINANNTGNIVEIKNIQLEKGSTATTYAPYFTPIELCKIGTYQDYIYKSGDDWYIHKDLSKIVIDGSQSVTSYGTVTTGKNRYSVPATGAANVAADVVVNVSDKFAGVTRGDTYSNVNGIYQATGLVGFYWDAISAYTTAQVQTWLSTNNVTAYYPLATPTDTKITNSALISQLEALNEATTYDGTTVITVDSENLAGSLEVTAAASIDKTYTEVEIGSPFTITDVEGKSSNTTLDGNVYVDWAYNKKQYSFDLFNLTPQDYADIRAFYDYQFNNSAFPTITVPELNIDKLPVYMEISSRNIINQCLLTDKLTIKFRETVQP